MWSLGSRLEQEQDDMSDQMQRQRRGCGGHPALHAKCDAPVTSISKLKSFEKPKLCKRKQRTCLVRSRLRCRPRKARCRRGLGSSRKRRALAAGPGGRRVWAPLRPLPRPGGPRAPSSPPGPGASEDTPGLQATPAGTGQGTPGLGQTSGTERLPWRLRPRDRASRSRPAPAWVRRAETRRTRAGRRARLTPRATPPPAPGRDGGGTRAPFLHPVGTRPGPSVRTLRARPPTRSCRGRGGSHAGRGRVRPWHLCRPRRDPSKDTNKRRGHDGQDGPCGDRLLGVLQVPGPVRACHDACSRGQSWHIPCKPGNAAPLATAHPKQSQDGGGQGLGHAVLERREMGKAVSPRGQG